MCRDTSVEISSDTEDIPDRVLRERGLSYPPDDIDRRIMNHEIDTAEPTTVKRYAGRSIQVNIHRRGTVSAPLHRTRIGQHQHRVIELKRIAYGEVESR